MREIEIRTEWIKLQDLLKFAALVGSGGEAKERIQAGEARVGGAPCLQRGRKIRPGDVVDFAGERLTVGYADQPS